MSISVGDVAEIDAIEKVINIYTGGAKSGKGADMKPAFVDNAIIYGYVGDDLAFQGPIQGLFDWNDSNGPAKDLEGRIAHIDVVGTIAHVRVEAENWTGHKFTDMFVLIKLDGHWKIVSKVFHLHAA